jgi:hypothetical protein
VPAIDAATAAAVKAFRKRMVPVSASVNARTNAGAEGWFRDSW